MYDLKLPKSTEFNRVIPKNKIFLYTVYSQTLRDIYYEQIDTVTWKNKLSKETFDIISDNAFSEIEVFDIAMKTGSIDKRLLRQIDKGIPYYIFHVLNHENRYQAWIANKRDFNGKIKVENYIRTLWLGESDFRFSFEGGTIQGIYNNLREQVEEKRKRKIVKSEQIEECNAFMDYFRTMKMSRSYKPVLILAAMQAGGSITIEQAAHFFVRFYHDRKLSGLKPEAGNCIYADDPDNISGIKYNIIRNPVAALCNSGFFEYDPENQVFSFANDIYDGLTLDEIDEIGSRCNERLKNYFLSIL